eukprot:CAMPEP_0198124284 /NCGR_PEP_ID=MMETSP1442-20131203/39608_1 /TAXON_ID= /ORGANISM="Craspedostauros australis, Strain CCMP3328" /LENGTH=130 /DNA_ID=CAMNT_0043783663 /DNA_START=439 /DNA_END=831 /DNA_ORIENTATION=+
MKRFILRQSKSSAFSSPTRSMASIISPIPTAFDAPSLTTSPAMMHLDHSIRTSTKNHSPPPTYMLPQKKRIRTMEQVEVIEILSDTASESADNDHDGDATTSTLSDAGSRDALTSDSASNPDHSNGEATK